MNVAYLKVTHGLRFHLFFFSFFLSFLGAGLLMCFHGHSRPSFGRKHEVRAVAGAGGGMVRHFIYFFAFFWEQLGWCPSGSWCPTQTVYSAYRERRYWDYVPVMVSFFILPQMVISDGLWFYLEMSVILTEKHFRVRWSSWIWSTQTEEWAPKESFPSQRLSQFSKATNKHIPPITQLKRKAALIHVVSH